MWDTFTLAGILVIEQIASYVLLRRVQWHYMAFTMSTESTM